jgi:hypothetical protein
VPMLWFDSDADDGLVVLVMRLDAGHKVAYVARIWRGRVALGFPSQRGSRTVGTGWRRGERGCSWPRGGSALYHASTAFAPAPPPPARRMWRAASADSPSVARATEGVEGVGGVEGWDGPGQCLG